MKAKLIKVENTSYYNLENEKGILIGTTFEFKNDVGENLYSLSYKNCQAIENGYDLDELADVFHEQHKFASSHIADITSFKQGFQKALSILGDKKFNEEDIIDCWETAHQAGRFEEKGIAETNWQTAINYAKSLQQNEWDVEIVMNTDCTGEFKYLLLDKGKPLFDADNCIILKRK